jgi:hypothetical protein
MKKFEALVGIGAGYVPFTNILQNTFAGELAVNVVNPELSPYFTVSSKEEFIAGLTSIEVSLMGTEVDAGPQQLIMKGWLNASTLVFGFGNGEEYQPPCCGPIFIRIMTVEA